MTRLALNFLGTWQATLDGAPITIFESDKVRSLLAYLAVEADRPHRRETLAALFWPERSEQNARQNLSQALFNLRQAIGDREINPSFLQITPQSIQFNATSLHRLDTAIFMTLYQACETHLHDHADTCSSCLTRLRTAIALYRGDFLRGFSLGDSNDFEEWLILKREQYKRQAVAMTTQLVTAYEQQGNLKEALTYAWRQVELEPWHEEAHQVLMRLLARNGQRSQALTQYERCRQILWEEVGVEPSADTSALYETIRDGIWEARQEHPLARKPEKNRRNQLILLDKVEAFWVKGFLIKALTDSHPIKVPIQRLDAVVTRPWDRVIQIPTGEENTSQLYKTIGEYFAEADQALLILGAPGAGKTVTLLQLARERIDQARLNEEEPLPVVLNLASWGERRQESFADWLLYELTTRYQIPFRIGRVWLDNHELLLLLDGLDEVPAELRGACIKALNRFRGEHGLIGLAVCCRQEAYEACRVPLNMGGAILIQPLAPAQVDIHLATNVADTPLRNRLQNDPTWKALATTPLMLNLMRRLYREHREGWVQKSAGESLTPPTDPRAPLLSAYIEQMLSHRPANSVYSPVQIKKALTWLAHHMTRHHQAIFLVEQLQPSWLAKSQRWQYLIISRGLSGVYVGLILWLIFTATQMLTPQVQGIIDHALLIRLLGNTPWHTFLSFILLNLGLGLGMALMDGMYFEHRHAQETENRLDPRAGWRQLIPVGIMVGILTALYYDPLAQPVIAIGSGVMEAILITYGLYFKNSQSYQTEVVPVEAVNWSWPDAVRGAFWGTLAGLAIGGLGWGLFGNTFAFVSGICLTCIFIIQGGLQHTTIEKRSLPNLGIRLSIRNGLLIATFLGLLLGSLTGMIWGTQFGILMGIIFFLGGAMVNGGQQSIRHGLVRLLLWQKEVTLLRLIPFLDTAADRILLHKVGGGYMFMHPLLQKHFAELYQIRQK